MPLVEMEDRAGRQIELGWYGALPEPTIEGAESAVAWIRSASSRNRSTLTAKLKYIDHVTIPCDDLRIAEQLYVRCSWPVVGEHFKHVGEGGRDQGTYETYSPLGLCPDDTSAAPSTAAACSGPGRRKGFCR
ncbi:hypothetical protein [Streptomyces sp. NPDC047453]|uniref:hypothetical protein n=1 Tax=Streptomyces sp. NPDC047453 TaxID=3154812 RepID=UPI003407DF92